MAVSGQDTIVAAVPTTTWDSAATLGALDGILPLSIDKLDKGGVFDFDDSSGLTFRSQGSIISEEANPSISGRCRWNGAWWAFLVNLIGDDTKTGTGPVYTHTMNYQAESPLVGLTLGVEINNTANGILEVSSLKVTSVTLEPDGGFWNFNVSTLGTSVDKAGNATNTGTEFDAVTYSSSAQRMRYKANLLRINAQAGSALASPTDDVSDASNMSISFSRDYDGNDDVLQGASTGKELVRAEPTDNGNGIVGTLQYDKKTLDLATHLNELGTEYKADIKMTETIGSDVHDFDLEMNDLVAIDPSVALERGQRIPMTHNYEMAQIASAGTGMTNANPFHIVVQNVSNLTYETNA